MAAKIGETSEKSLYTYLKRRIDELEEKQATSQGSDQEIKQEIDMLKQRMQRLEDQGVSDEVKQGIKDDVKESVEDDVKGDIHQEVAQETAAVEEEVRDELGQQAPLKHKAADHYDHSKAGSNPSGSSLSLDHDIQPTRIDVMMLLAMGLHLIDYAYMGIDLSQLPLKLVLYAVLGLTSYFVLEGGERGLGKRQALRHYTALTALSAFFFPLITSAFSQFVPDTVLQEVQAARLLLAWYPLYYLAVRGVARHKSYSSVQGWLGGFISPVTLVKRFYIALILFAIINVGLASVVTETASDLDNQLGDTPRLNPSRGFERVYSFFYDGFNKSVTSVSDFITERVNDTARFVQDPLGTGYETQVEDNILGVEVNMEKQNARSVVRRFEGDQYNLQAAIQYSSQYELESPARFICELVNSEGDVVRQYELDSQVLGGSATNSVFKTCSFDDLSTDDRSTARYTVKMRSVLPFRTQAATEYYFASDDFARDPAQAQQYRSNVQDLDADTADAITTEGPVKLKTSNDLVNLPVVVSEDANKMFPYGFSLEATQGEIRNITRVEMDIPEYFAVNETPTCQYAEGGANHLGVPRPGYKKIVFDEYLYINRNEEPYASCNLVFDSKFYDELIWSEDTIQPVTFSVIADYTYEMEVEQDLVVEERVLAPNEVDDTRGSNNESVA